MTNMDGKRTQHKGHLAKARKKSAKCPEYRGVITIGEREFWLSGWVALDPFGRKYLSLRATERADDEK